MAEQTQKASLKMLCKGMALGIVSDLQPEGKFKFLQNIRVYEEGAIESRPLIDAMLTIGAGADGSVPHTIKTIIDKSTNNFNRIVGQGTKIFTGNSSPLVQKVTGLSGAPLFLVDFRPEQSVEAYVYIADENKFVKISVSDILSDVGVTAPVKSADWKLGERAVKIIDRIDTGSDAAWNNLTGSAAAPTLETRVSTTVTKYIADDTLPNFASVVPAAFDPALQQDSIVTINGVDVIVTEVLPSALNAGVATISSIQYAAGVSGIANIVLSVSSPNLRRNSILLLGGTEYVRVLDVTKDSNNIPSFKVSTVGTFAVGATVSGASSFRFFDVTGFAPAHTIVNKAIKTVISADGISSITRIFNVDMLNTGSGGRALTMDDIFHASLLLSNSANITEVQIQFDVDSVVNDFTRNYYYYAINPNFFTGSVNQTTPTISVIQQTIQRTQLINKVYQPYYIEGGYETYYPEENPDTSVLVPISQSAQTALGKSQWTEANIKLGDFKRVGSDFARTLKDVKAIRISVTAIAPVDLFVDSLWVGGADVLESASTGFLPYNYVWRVRDPATRARSNWSPPLRTGIKLSRGRVVLSFPGATTDFPTNYQIDIARYGGTLNSFRIIGSIANNGSLYTDTSSDRIVADNERAGRTVSPNDESTVFDYYKPFTLLDVPKKGTCNVAGAHLYWVSGDKLKTSYPRGVQIIVNGIANRFFTAPTTDVHVELERDMGNLTNVSFELLDPIMVGQPLPVIFGPFGEGNFGLYIFGLGDENAAGTLYWLDGNSPDTMSNLNRLEITSPSEPLVVGVMYDGYGFVFTNERSFMLVPTVAPDGTFGFIARENANSRGVYSRNCITTSPAHIYFLSENADGLYRVEGTGNPQCITNGTMGNLFYRNGKIPQSITLVDGTIIYPPDFTNLNELRLYSTNDYVFFKYKNTHPTNPTQVVLVYDCKINDFISYDTYPFGQVDVFYLEEKESSTAILVGYANGVAQVKTSTIIDVGVESRVIPFSMDMGDARAIKLFLEEMVSVNRGTAGFTMRNYYDNGDTFDAPIVIPGLVSPKREQIITDLGLGKGIAAKNITTVFFWSVLSKTKLYEEVIYFQVQPDETKNRVSGLEDAGNIGAKLWQGVIIDADTGGNFKTLYYADDDGIIRASVTLNHNGRKIASYSFDQPFISHAIYRSSTDGVEWQVFSENYIYDLEPEAAQVWEGEFNTSNLTGLLLMRRMAVAYRSNDETTLILNFGDGVIDTYSIPSSGGAWRKHFFPTQARKWRSCKYRFEVNNVSTANYLRLYKKASEVWLKTINSPEGFSPVQPFGGDSNVTDIRI
jgi:hypothetical protein